MTAQQTTAGTQTAPERGPGFLPALARAVRDQARRALSREVPFTQVLDEIAGGVWEQLAGLADEETLRGWLQAAAGVSTADLRREAERTAAAVASDLPAILRTQLAVYLAQTSATVRQALRRPSDPLGQRVPPDLLLQRPDDLLPMLPPRPALYRPGDRPDGLEQWRLEELLALNEVSEVWRARPARGDGGPVVLKFWPEKLARQELFYRDTTNLLDLLQDQPLPGIAALRQVYPDRDPVCLEYEHVDGACVAGLVHKWARSHSADHVEQSARLLLGLAQVVAQAHDRDEPLVHGNLKLAHLLLYPVPNGPLMLRVTDYGLGRVAMQREVQAAANLPPGLARLLGWRGARGTLCASPQVLAGALPGPADDVWSLGAIAYQMLLADPSAEVDCGFCDRLAELRVPRPLLRVIGACLREQPQRRPTAQAVVEALEQVLTPRIVAVLPADTAEHGARNSPAERIRRLHERASQLAQKADYTGAADILEAVPERLRNAGLYERLCGKRDRAQQLDREIIAALRAGNHQGLRDRVEELLRLKPMRTELRELLNELPGE